MTAIHLTRAAIEDLAEIRRYSLAEFGSAATIDYLAGLEETLGRLRDFPDIGVRRDDLHPDTRSLRFRNHRIYYRPHGSGLLVQRVLHNARMIRRNMIE